MGFTNQVANKLRGLVFGEKINQPDMTAQAQNILNKSPAEINTSPLAHMQENPFQFGTVSYPENVEEGNMEGHYIVFHILTSTPGSGNDFFDAPLEGVQTVNTTVDVADKSFSFSKASNLDNDFNTAQQEQQRQNTINQYDKKARMIKQGGLESLGARFKYTRTKDIITMYMPPQVSVEYKPKYKNESLGMLGKIVATAGSGQGFFEMAGDAMTVVGDAITDSLKKLQTEARSFSTGNITLDRQEVLFEGIDFRTFSYDFNFLPKTPQESIAVDKITKLFKYHTMPQITAASVGTYDFQLPSQFQIQYMYREKQNTFLHNIGNVVCTGCSLTYGSGDTWTTFRPLNAGNGSNAEGPPPVITNMKLDFQEVDLIDRNAIAKGNF